MSMRRRKVEPADPVDKLEEMADELIRFAEEQRRYAEEVRAYTQQQRERLHRGEGNDGKL